MNEHSNAPLTELERALLAFETSWWSGSTPKDEAVRTEFQMTAEEYGIMIDQLIDREAAMEFDPLVVRRLRRLRDRRRREHGARRSADGGPR
ncbi:MAG: DUF3263 domain-containing protein [Acidimicrobiales bacterium]|jgi:hypothetical protein